MSIELSQNENIITVICNDKGELGMLTKDELEDYIYENLTEAVDISDEMFNEFRKNGRLDITIKKEEKVTIEQQTGTTANPFEKLNENKKEQSSTTTNTTNLKVFGETFNLKGYQIIAPYLEKHYFIKEAIIRRGQSAFSYEIKYESPTEASFNIQDIGSIYIKLLHKITSDITYRCTGMDNRRVISHISHEKDGEIHIIAEFDLEDNEGPVIGKYRLIHAQAIAQEILNKNF